MLQPLSGLLSDRRCNVQLDTFLLGLVYFCFPHRSRGEDKVGSCVCVSKFQNLHRCDVSQKGHDPPSWGPMQRLLVLLTPHLTCVVNSLRQLPPVSQLSTRLFSVFSAQRAHNLALAAAVQFGGTPEQKKLTEALLTDLCKEDKDTFSRLGGMLESTASQDSDGDVLVRIVTAVDCVRAHGHRRAASGMLPWCSSAPHPQNEQRK